MSSTSPPRRRVSVPVSGTALLLIDVINDMAFEGSEALVRRRLEAVEAIEGER